MLKILKKIDHAMSQVEFLLICIFLSTILVFSFAGVLLRNVFESGYPWMDTLAKNLVLWITMLGAALAAKNRRTLNIEVLNRLIPESKKKYLDLILTLTGLVTCAAVCVASVLFLQSEGESHESGLWNVRVVYIYVIIPIGYFLIAYHFLVQLVEQMVELFRGSE